MAVEDSEEATLRYSMRGYHTIRSVVVREMLRCERE